MLVGHRVATVFDDDGLAVETLDVGQGFGQDGGLDAGCEVFNAHGRLQVESPRIVQRKRPEWGPAFVVVCTCSADSQSLRRAFSAFRQGQFKDAIIELGLGLAIVDFLPQLK